jgi:hypothetical protein
MSAHICVVYNTYIDGWMDGWMDTYLEEHNRDYRGGKRAAWSKGRASPQVGATLIYIYTIL